MGDPTRAMRSAAEAAGLAELRALLARGPDPAQAKTHWLADLGRWAGTLLAEVDRLRKENELLSTANGAYWAAQRVLDEALGTEEEHGSGGGLADEVRLLMEQRDKAVEALRADKPPAEVVRRRQPSGRSPRMDEVCEAVEENDPRIRAVLADYLEAVAPEGGGSDA